MFYGCLTQPKVGAVNVRWRQSKRKTESSSIASGNHTKGLVPKNLRTHLSNYLKSSGADFVRGISIKVWTFISLGFSGARLWERVFMCSNMLQEKQGVSDFFSDRVNYILEFGIGWSWVGHRHSVAKHTSIPVEKDWSLTSIHMVDLWLWGPAQATFTSPSNRGNVQRYLS